MKLTQGIIVAILRAGMFLLPTAGKAQVITAGPDSVAVQTTTLPDTTIALATEIPVPDTASGFFLKTWDKPSKAALYSAVLPGAGQVYNKAIWKVPIIYAAGGVLGYFLIDNNNKYQDFRKALLIRNDGDPNTIDKYATSPYYSESFPRGKENLRSSRDFYRRNRDLTVLLSILTYGLNIAEAYVHAHLKTFDVSDELSLNVQPSLVPVYTSPAYTTGLVPGITLTLYTTK